MSQQLLWNGTTGGIVGVLEGVDRTTSINGIGLFGVSILFMIWLMIYFRLRNEPTREAVVGASFVTAIAGLLLRALGAVQDTVFAICLIMLAGSIMLLINREG